MIPHQNICFSGGRLSFGIFLLDKLHILDMFCSICGSSSFLWDVEEKTSQFSYAFGYHGKMIILSFLMMVVNWYSHYNLQLERANLCQILVKIWFNDVTWRHMTSAKKLQNRHTSPNLSNAVYNTSHTFMRSVVW